MNENFGDKDDIRGIHKNASRESRKKLNRLSIISGKSAPSLSTCIKIALAMHLDNHECKYLLKKASFTLSSANRYALIIRYAIENKIYDISEVNSLLLDNGCEEFLLL